MHPLRKLVFSLALGLGILTMNSAHAAHAGDVSELADISEYVNKNACFVNTTPYFVWRAQFVGYFAVTPNEVLKSKLLTSVEISIFLSWLNKETNMNVSGDLIEVFKDDDQSDFYVAVVYKGCLVANGPVSLENMLKFTGQIPVNGHPYQFDPQNIEV